MPRQRIFPDTFAKLVSYLPFSALYGLSTALSFLVSGVLGYRKEVVTSNLANSFPGSSTSELRRWRRHFYRNLTDLFVEVIKGMTISAEALSKRLVYHDLSVLEQLYKEGRSVIVVGGHRGNWEWSVPLLQTSVSHRVATVYKPLSNDRINDLMLATRGRFGTELVAMNAVARHIARNRDPWIRVFIADQSPPAHEIQHFMTFLGQDTPVYLGPAKIARSSGHAVVFMDAVRKSRGRYDVGFELVTRDPGSESEAGITECFNRLLEKGIRAQPDNWLWSHRRWKHSRDRQNQA